MLRTRIVSFFSTYWFQNTQLSSLWKQYIVLHANGEAVVGAMIVVDGVLGKQPKSVTGQCVRIDRGIRIWNRPGSGARNEEQRRWHCRIRDSIAWSGGISTVF
jgi:hypothetical protein